MIRLVLAFPLMLVLVVCMIPSMVMGFFAAVFQTGINIGFSAGVKMMTSLLHAGRK